jgi:hypothetical protein
MGQEGDWSLLLNNYESGDVVVWNLRCRENPLRRQLVSGASSSPQHREKDQSCDTDSRRRGEGLLMVVTRRTEEGRRE